MGIGRGRREDAGDAIVLPGPAERDGGAHAVAVADVGFFQALLFGMIDDGFEVVDFVVAESRSFEEAGGGFAVLAEVEANDVVFATEVPLAAVEAVAHEQGASSG